MRKNRRKRSKNKGIWFFRAIAIISIIIFIVFGIMLYVLDMIPFKYLIIFYIVFGLLYLYLFINSSNIGTAKEGVPINIIFISLFINLNHQFNYIVFYTIFQLFYAL